LTLYLRQQIKIIKNKMKSVTGTIVVIVLMILAAFSRLIPHVPNFTPTESIVIFGGAYLASRYMSVIIPIIVLYLSDFVINNTIARSFFPDVNGIVWWDNYMFYTIGAIALIALISRVMLKKVNVLNVLGTVLVSSIIFFLLTNFGAWASAKSIYPQDANGLMMSYVAAIPFYKTSLFGNLLFTAIMFGSKELIESMMKAKNSKAVELK